MVVALVAVIYCNCVSLPILYLLVYLFPHVLSWQNMHRRNFIFKQELAKNITLHANGESLLKHKAPYIHIVHQFHNDSACCLVCQW